MNGEPEHIRRAREAARRHSARSDQYSADERGDAYEPPADGQLKNGQPHAPTPHCEEAPALWSDPQPIPSGLLPVVPFDFAMLPGAFVTFVTDVSERMQCPPDFPAVAIMVATAGVVGKRIGIRPKRHDDWTVVPNLWGAVIGRPGIMKTPAIAQPLKFLRRLEEEAKVEYENQLRGHQDHLSVAEIKTKQRRNAIENAIKKGEDPFKAAEKVPVDEPEEPSRHRYVINDSTVEKTGVLLNENPTGLLLFRDEIAGFLERLDRSGQEGARAFYLEAWDGTGKFTYDRIGRGTLDIDSVTLSVLGGCQPGKFCSYLHAAIHGGAGDDGLCQRLQLLVYPDVSKAWRNVDQWPDTAAKQRVWEVFKRLDTLKPEDVRAERYDGEIPFLRFEENAQGVFDAWRAELEVKVRSGDEHPALESHLAKYRSLVPSLALLIALVDGETASVSLGALEKAIAWAKYLESHARRVYGLAIDPAAQAARALAKRIKDGDVKDCFSLRDVYRRHWSGLSERETLEPAVHLLIDLNWLKEGVHQTSGAPKTFYLINPALTPENGHGEK